MKKILESIELGIATATIMSMLFLMAEPALIRGASVEDQHTITQTINAEVSFVTAANDVTMNNTIGGVTGGFSYGTATVAVSTNDPLGFTMTIKASTTPAMKGNNIGDTISDYTPASAGVPDFAFVNPGSGAVFGYSVSASTTANLAQKFKDDTAACNTGSADTSGSASCWYGLSTTATTTVVTAATTSPSGATSSVYYKVYVAANANKAAGTYTATTTLTATTN